MQTSQEMVKFMLTRKTTLIHDLNFKFIEDIEDIMTLIMLHKTFYILYPWNKYSIIVFTISFE